MKIRKPWLLALAILSSIGLNAQNLVVTLTNSTTETFPIADIQSIKFGQQTMILNELDGTVNTWNIVNINNYAFQSVANVNETTTITTDELSLFPNPSTDQVNINYTSNQSGSISFAIYDINGQMVEELFNGEHHEVTNLVWSISKNRVVPSGKYLIQITTTNKVITKPIIIQ